MKAEVKLAEGTGVGDEILVGGGTRGGAEGAAKPAKSSDAKRSFDIATGGLAAGAETFPKGKSKPFGGARLVKGFG